jgi:hypothetical protein
MTIHTMHQIARMTLMGLALLPRLGSFCQSPHGKVTTVPKMWEDAAMSTPP